MIARRARGGIDGDERGEWAHQAVVERGLLDLGGEIEVVFEGGAIVEIRDSRPGPDRGDAFVLNDRIRSVKLHEHLAGFTAEFSLDPRGRAIGGTSVTAGDDDGPADEKIGELLRIDLAHL